MQNITVTELKKKWDNREPFILLDVRETFEVHYARIEPFIHIPMGFLPARITELKKEMPVVVICHTGVRSVQVCHFLERSGFDAINVLGGIDGWSIEIDPSVPRY
ncbi:MAG: rhodanese-like domain-containing protein [Fidelibacterota bacterium]